MLSISLLAWSNSLCLRSSGSPRLVMKLFCIVLSFPPILCCFLRITSLILAENWMAGNECSNWFSVGLTQVIIRIFDWWVSVFLRQLTSLESPSSIWEFELFFLRADRSNCADKQLKLFVTNDFIDESLMNFSSATACSDPESSVKLKCETSCSLFYLVFFMRVSYTSKWDFFLKSASWIWTLSILLDLKASYKTV